jgi:hypothetical protein
VNLIGRRNIVPLARSIGAILPPAALALLLAGCSSDSLAHETVRVAAPPARQAVVKPVAESTAPETASEFETSDVSALFVPAADPPPPSRRADTSSYYTIKRADSLWSIAKEMLGDGNRWREIWEANRRILPNPRRLKPGMRLALVPKRGVEKLAAAPPIAPDRRPEAPARKPRTRWHDTEFARTLPDFVLAEARPVRTRPGSSRREKLESGRVATIVKAVPEHLPAALQEGSSGDSPRIASETLTRNAAVAEVLAVSQAAGLGGVGPKWGSGSLTRRELAKQVFALIKRFETRSSKTWKHASPKFSPLSDLPETDPDRLAILEVVNEYRLFDNVFAVWGEGFGPDSPVIREEAAQIFKNLLSDGEAAGALETPELQAEAAPFPDVSPLRRSYDATLELRKRSLLAGFSDNTFRPDDDLTRYHYVALAARALTLVKQAPSADLAISPDTPQDGPLPSWSYDLESSPPAAENADVAPVLFKLRLASGEKLQVMQGFLESSPIRVRESSLHEPDQRIYSPAERVNKH